MQVACTSYLFIGIQEHFRKIKLIPFPLSLKIRKSNGIKVSEVFSVHGINKKTSNWVVDHTIIVE